jgi:hypothetical protein
MQPGFFDADDFLQRFGDYRGGANRFRDDAADFGVQRISAVEPEILLATAKFGAEKAFAFETNQFFGKIGRVDGETLGEIAQVKFGGGIGKVIGKEPLASFGADVDHG